MNNFDDLLNNSPAEQQNGAQLSKEDYAAKKKSERDEIFELSDNTALEVSSDGDMFQEYLDLQSRFDRYSAVNALLIMAQNPEATRLGDFDYWKGKELYIKKGETGISILEPHPYAKEDGSQGTGYNLKKVFDISQIDTRKYGTPVPAQTPTQKYTDRQLLQALISKAPVKIVGVDVMPNYVPEEQGAIYDMKDEQIIVKKGMEFADTFQSVAQELVFVEIERSKSDSEPVNSHFSAYSAAYMLCKKYGVDTQGFDFSDAPDVLNGLEPQHAKEELQQIRNAAESISGRIAKHLDVVTKAAKSQEER